MGLRHSIQSQIQYERRSNLRWDEIIVSAKKLAEMALSLEKEKDALKAKVAYLESALKLSHVETKAEKWKHIRTQLDVRLTHYTHINNP